MEEKDRETENARKREITCHPLHRLPGRIGRFELRWLKLLLLTEPAVLPVASAATPAGRVQPAAAVPTTQTHTYNA